MDYKVSLSAVNIPEETYPLMEKALREGKIGQTEIIQEFEQLVANYVGAKYCIAVSNGTMADAVAVAALVQQSKEFDREIKKVVVPALTFIAQPNSVRYNNLPVEFADVKEDWTTEFQAFYNDRLIFSTDLMGRQAIGPIDIEDACEAFGSRFMTKAAGLHGQLGTYSFFPSHTISTGEGGAIVTDDADLAYLCKHIRAHGYGSIEPMDKFHFPYFGFNARMTSIQAVLGIALMGHIKEYIEARRIAFYTLRARLRGNFEERPGEEIVPHGFPIEFDSEANRDIAMRAILSAGVECRKFFSCIPLEEPYYKREGSWPVAQHISHTYLYVPCHQNMRQTDVAYVADVVCDQKGRVLGDPIYQNRQRTECECQSEPGCDCGKR